LIEVGLWTLVQGLTQTFSELVISALSFALEDLFVSYLAEAGTVTLFFVFFADFLELGLEKSVYLIYFCCLGLMIRAGISTMLFIDFL
jgi:hypothetical protein